MTDLCREALAGFYGRQVKVNLRGSAISIHSDVRCAILVELKVRGQVGQFPHQFVLPVTDTAPLNL